MLLLLRVVLQALLHLVLDSRIFANVLLGVLEGLSEDLLGHLESKPSEVRLIKLREVKARFFEHLRHLEICLFWVGETLSKGLVLSEILLTELLLEASGRETTELVRGLSGLAVRAMERWFGAVIVRAFVWIRENRIGLRNFGEHLCGCFAIIRVFVLYDWRSVRDAISEPKIYKLS